MRNKEHNFTADPQQRETATNKSIEARKNDPNKTAGKKQAVTRFVNNALFENPTRALYQNKHLDDAVADVLINEMFSIAKKDEKSWIETYAHNYLQSALIPDTPAAGKIANALFNDNFINQLQEYLERQAQKDVDFYKYQLLTTLYDKQQQVFIDETSKKHVIINSRRSGKTELMGRLLAKGLLLPDAHCVYINRNSSAAIRQIRKPLETSLLKIGLKCIKGSVDAQEMYFENGSQLLIIGNNNSADVDKLRGERISTCIMDECGHQRNTRQLMREVIDPALRDYGKDARLYMVGTPPRTRGTYVEDVYENAVERGWKVWHWTFEDNPFIPDRDKVIEEVCRENGCSPDSAFIQREYYGRMDAYDDEAIVWNKYVFKKEEASNASKTFTHAYIGVDWGFEDSAAVVGVVADLNARKAFVVKSWSENHKSVSEICQAVLEMKKYIEDNYRLQRPIWIICDNNEKSAVYELQTTYKVKNVFTAYKYDKEFAIEQLSDLLANEYILLTDNKNAVESIITDFENTVWERDDETDKLLHTIDDDIWHPNSAMALLYVSRQLCVDIFGMTEYNKTAKDVLAEHGIME